MTSYESSIRSSGRSARRCPLIVAHCRHEARDCKMGGWGYVSSNAARSRNALTSLGPSAMLFRREPAAVTECLLAAWNGTSLIDMATRNSNAVAKERVGILSAELSEAAEALRLAAADQDRITQLFMDGVVTHANAASFNERLSKATATKEAMAARRDALQRELEALRAMLASRESETLVDRMAQIAADFGKLTAVSEKRAFLRAVVLSVDRNEKGTWTIKRHVPSSTNEPQWHSLHYDC